jgi:hypothetical protein
MVMHMLEWERSKEREERLGNENGMEKAGIEKVGYMFR